MGVRIAIFGHRGHAGSRYVRATQALGWTVGSITGRPRPMFAVCCWPPQRHHEAHGLCADYRIPLLTEKPTSNLNLMTRSMYRQAQRSGIKLATAFVHLHNPLLMRLRGSPVRRIVWKGPNSVYSHRAHGRPGMFCDAAFEWGAHAWSMAAYLQAEESVVDTGYSETRETLVETDAGTYAGEYEAGDNEPISRMLLDFAAWLGGADDERFIPELGLWVSERCHCGK